MFRYPFQNGVVLFNVILLKLFENNAFLAFQVINLIFQIVFIEYLGKIAHLMWGEKNVTTLTRLVVAFFPCYFFYISYNYGTIISLSLIVVAIYMELLYFDTSLKRHALWSALLAALACVFKSNSRIIVVAMLIVLLLELIENRKKMVMGIAFMIMLISFRPLASLAIDGCVEKITEVETPTGMPELNWIAMGLTDPGNYNGTSVNIFADAGYDSEKSKEMSFEFIKKRIEKMNSDRSEALKWLGRKQAMNWNDPTFEALGLNSNREYAYFASFFNSLFSGELSKVIIAYLNYIQSTLLLGAVIFTICNDQKAYKTLILLIACIGGFLFHIFWEGASHYLLPYFVMMIPYSVYGFNVAIKDFLNNRVKKVRVLVIVAVFLLLILLRNSKLLEYTIFIQDDMETVWEYYVNNG